MSSPSSVSIHFYIRLDRKSEKPLFRQIADHVRHVIEEGIIVTGAQLPGSRVLSKALGVHRKTVIAAYEELAAEGVVQTVADKGTFVQIEPRVELEERIWKSFPSKSNFHFPQSRLLEISQSPNSAILSLTDGQPDVRLFPINKLTKTIRRIGSRQQAVKWLEYSDSVTNNYYQKEVTLFLKESRALDITSDNILTTRGIQMGLYLITNLLIRKADKVIVAEIGNHIANMTFQQAEAQLLMVSVDHQGIVVEEVEKLCRYNDIRALYITPHHHYPTTVTLSFERKLALLKLAEQYGFVIIEDDQDYDFHYIEKPQMPLCSLDRLGNTIYLSSFCKMLAPGLRAGYIVAPADLIVELSKLRRLIDHQSDLLLEQALGELLHEGEIQRHFKKVKKIYHQRRDHLDVLLKSKLEERVTYTPPPGGLALWTLWDRRINLMQLRAQCAQKGVYIPQTILYQTKRFSAMRLGFGNLTNDEMEKVIDIIQRSL